MRILLILIIAIIVQSCSILTIQESNKRLLVPNEIVLKPDLKLLSTGAVYINFANIMKADFLPASIKIEFKEKIIYIDPVVVQDTDKADYILITHNHVDHFSIQDIMNLKKSETIIIGPETIVKKLPDDEIKVVKTGDTLNFENITFEAVEAYNIKKGFFNFPLHKKSDMNLGYIISCDGTRIYHAGDTDFIPEMNKIKNITISLIPIGEGKTAMNPQQAAEAVNIIKPEIAVPVHYELGNKSEILFKELVNKEINVIILQK